MQRNASTVKINVDKRNAAAEIIIFVTSVNEIFRKKFGREPENASVLLWPAFYPSEGVCKSNGNISNQRYQYDM
jgi:hypothetical protein